jgi:hypothetical protein
VQVLASPEAAQALMEQALTPVIAGQPAEQQEEPKQEPFFWEPGRHAAIFGAANPSLQF